MLDGKTRTAFIILEFALYAVCFFAAHFFPYLVIHPFATEFDYLLDALTGVVVAGLILAVVVLLYMRIYDNRQKQLESLDRLKTEFFQNMNHDMKTPLAVLASYIGNADDMLDYGVSTAEVQECLERAGEQIGNLARMVDYSLSLAAAQEGKWRMETLDFADLLRSGAGAFRAPLKENGNTLSIQIPDGLPKITGNGDMLKQAINNLLSNAAKHTRNGEITVSLNREGGKLTATVADTGEGIDPALLPGVFKRGVSGDGTTGYGLSISKTIVETHGGEIRIESEPGKGTTVCFTLPIRREGTL
jgi:signal transduction histidine kinase